MKNRKILFIVHRVYFENVVKKGGVDRIIDFLKQDNETYLIEHPLDGTDYPSVFSLPRFKKNYFFRFTPPLRWIEEVIVNFLWIKRAAAKFDLIVAIDPLCFLSAYLIKKSGSATKIQFHSTDYSLPRFGNFVLEFFYQRLYLLALKKADIVTVVSHKMAKKARQLMNGKADNLFILPNSPEFQTIPKTPIEKRKINHFAMSIGIFENQVDINNLIDGLKLLKNSSPDFVLEIIGHVDKKHIDIFYQNNLKKNVIFHGILPYAEAVEKMSRNYIGLTCYSSKYSYVHYADSLKIREYAAAGLPVVCDNIYDTAQEVKKNKAGLVYNNSREMANCLIKLISDKNLYGQMSANALDWAKTMDKTKLLTKLYQKYQ